MPRKFRLKKYAEEIKVKGGDWVNTRLSKKEFENRREAFNDLYSQHYGGHDYLDFVEWGGLGGRPKIYQDEKDKYKAYRIRKKLNQDQPLNIKEIEWLRSKGINVPRNNKLANIS